MRLWLLLVAATVAWTAAPPVTWVDEILVGGYGREGVVAFRWPQSALTPERKTVATVSSPTFIRSHPKLPVYYVTLETVGGKKNLLAVTASGVVLSTTSSGGVSPVRSDVNRHGDRLAVANYDGSIALYALGTNGAIVRSLSTFATTMPASKPASKPAGPTNVSSTVTTTTNEHASRQTSSHPHSVTFSPSGSEVWVADLGADSVLRFSLGPSRSILSLVQRIEMPRESGPRQVVFGATSLAYVANELDGSIAILRTSGSATTVQSRTLVRENAQLAELVLDATGRWLIALSRGTNECVVYAIDGDSLREASASPCGNWPRHGAFNKSGDSFYVGSQHGNEVWRFTFNNKLGTLMKSSVAPFQKPAVVVPL